MKFIIYIIIYVYMYLHTHTYDKFGTFVISFTSFFIFSFFFFYSNNKKRRISQIISYKNDKSSVWNRARTGSFKNVSACSRFTRIKRIDWRKQRPPGHFELRFASLTVSRVRDIRRGMFSFFFFSFLLWCNRPNGTASKRTPSTF